MILNVGYEKALFITQKKYADFVFYMARLESNPFTLQEVQTILAGTTVDAHKISDQNQVLNIANGWSEIINQVSKHIFTVDKNNFIHINTIVAKDEALEVGAFRSGQVGISGTEYLPPNPGPTLDIAFENMLKNYSHTENIKEKSFGIFLDAARAQFFYDGNKRTGQLMMNGVLISNGYLPVTILPGSHAEYNHKMLNFYETGDHAEMCDFLRNQYEKIYRGFDWSGITTSIP